MLTKVGKNLIFFILFLQRVVANVTVACKAVGLALHAKQQHECCSINQLRKYGKPSIAL